jgi:hypothetical protein
MELEESTPEVSGNQDANSTDRTGYIKGQKKRSLRV